MMNNHWQPSVTLMQTRVVDQPAFILHRRDWQNSSLILDLFTLEFGRITLLAKGARQQKSKALFQPFSILTVGWSGRQNLKTLTSIDGRNAAIDEKNYLALLYINELLNNMLPMQESNIEVFNQYLQLLNSASSILHESDLREFEIGMLRTLGYFPEINIETETSAPIQSGEYYQFHLNHGFVLCSEHDKDSLCGRWILDWIDKNYEDKNVQRLARSILRSTIDFNLSGKTLKSREVYMQIKRRQ